MSRVTSAFERVRRCRWLGFLATQAAAFWWLQVSPVRDEGAERDPLAAAEPESFFWRAERQHTAW